MAAVWWEERAKEDRLTARATVLLLPTISPQLSHSLIYCRQSGARGKGRQAGQAVLQRLSARARTLSLLPEVLKYPPGENDVPS